jgi:type IV pilus assembly protein PilP
MKKIHVYLVALGLVSLNACFNGDKEVRVFVENIKKTSTGKINELPAAKEYVSEDYTAQDLRSPFDAGNKTAMTANKSNAGQAANQSQRPDASRAREYLEHFPLDNFIMVGTMSKKNYNWGLIKDKAGMVHAVKIGDYIGENSGRITSVTDDKINIIETVSDGEGGWTQIPTSLGMKAN